MLTQLSIVNFAIIEELKLDLGPGFTVLTGETGAGKSIIIDAVELLLGGRADAAKLRKGADFALVEGIFEMELGDLAEVHTLLEEQQLVDDPRFVVLAREIRREGRNLCRINGRVVSLALLRTIGEWLVDVHGQSEHLSLLKVSEHLPLLDRFAHADLDEYSKAYRRITAVRKEREQMESAEREVARREDLLRYQIDEIETARLRLGEVPELETERGRLANAEKLAGLALNARGALEETTGDRASAEERLGEATGALISLAEIDPAMRGVSQRAQSLVEELGQLASELRTYLEEVQPDPMRLDEVEARLNMIHDLRRKYGNNVEAILQYSARAGEELESIVHAEERLEALRVEEDELLARLAMLGGQLTQTRRDSARELSEAITEDLAELNMEGAQFAVEIEWRDDPNGVLIEGKRVAFGRHGLDQVEFLVAPNPGEGLRPLAKVASGGETSRLMLGLKSVLASADRRPTLIFDEIDQGIGGRIGTVVGSKLKGLAQRHQVLCVTHLPQLAARADWHYQVEKHVEHGRTLARVSPLEREARLDELAEMLGDLSEANRKSAEALLEGAVPIL
ncbi:MAG: DNA repair protein RecN [Anaerolineae bacterium]|nr:MAG: DNA repair protein RecN [Anaerolineae bacterium]